MNLKADNDSLPETLPDLWGGLLQDAKNRLRLSGDEKCLLHRVNALLQKVYASVEEKIEGVETEEAVKAVKLLILGMREKVENLTS
ncbi:hypothetical protein KAI54_04210 [Candidatus Gracilibacteria bacterium]|nr:hypothetical protein [Candidatus Gracilibacteria bacterium]